MAAQGLSRARRPSRGLLSETTEEHGCRRAAFTEGWKGSQEVCPFAFWAACSVWVSSRGRGLPCGPGPARSPAWGRQGVVPAASPWSPSVLGRRRAERADGVRVGTASSSRSGATMLVGAWGLRLSGKDPVLSAAKPCLQPPA